MTTSFNIAAATSAELLTFFNANTGGAQIKKFADRPTAEKRVQKLVDEMLAEENIVPNVDYQKAAEVSVDFLQGASSVLADEVGSEDPSQAEIDASNADACPSCGATLDITSGRIVERFGKQSLVDEGMFTCHGCGNEWGTPDAPAKKAKASVYKTVRNNMVSSLKLDRRIVHVETDTVYPNALQVRKAGLMSPSQADRLSSVLYTAAKKNDRVTTVINGHTFRLFA